MMPNVTLRPINVENWRKIARMSDKLPVEQRRYVAHNAISILDAHYNPEHEFVRGIYAEDMPIGLLMYGFNDDDHTWWIIRLMIAHDQQGKGYGRAAMHAAIALLKTMPNCTSIYISFVPENETARKLYASLGFVDTGKIDDGEVVYRLDLS
jgi:diamine N-acetyltransferase